MASLLNVFFFDLDIFTSIFNIARNCNRNRSCQSARLSNPPLIPAEGLKSGQLVGRQAGTVQGYRHSISRLESAIPTGA
jgi:hypothetical protein